MSYSEDYIRQLFLEFQSLKKYTDKIAFYDKQFNIIPFSFPPFQTDILAFFGERNIQELALILQQEGKSAATLKKEFCFRERNYEFNIKPANSNNVLLNNYIIAKFIGQASHASEIIHNEIKASLKAGQSLPELLLATKKMLKFIEKKLHYEYDRSLMIKCMNVFNKGLMDFFVQNERPPFTKRRKFTELYLYSQGFLFGQYIEMLRKLDNSNNAMEMSVTKSFRKKQDLSQKILVLKDLGIIDAIRKKYVFLGKAELDNKMIELICMITGANPANLLNTIDILTTSGIQASLETFGQAQNPRKY